MVVKGIMLCIIKSVLSVKMRFTDLNNSTGTQIVFDPDWPVKLTFLVLKTTWNIMV